MRLRTVVFWLVLLALLVPAGLVTWARLVEPTGEWGLRLVAFTPLAMLGYGAALVLVLVRVVLPGRGLRLVWLAFAAALVVPLALHAWWYAPQVVGPQPPAAADAQPFTVLTANLLAGGVDELELVSAASHADVDLLVVQEVTPGAVRAMESGGLAERWPYRVGVPRTGMAGTMVFSRFELGEPTRLPTEMDGWRVEVTAPEGPLHLVAVHAWPPTDPGQWRRDHAAVLAAARGADLVVGDFNATPDHAPMRALADAGLRSAAEVANEGWQPTWPMNRSWLGITLPPLVQIDHVLVGDRVAVLSTRTVRLAGSDHRAVIAELAPQ